MMPSTDRFLTRQRFPRFSRSEVLALHARFHDDALSEPDRQAARNELIGSVIPLAIRKAAELCGSIPGLAADDLVNEIVLDLTRQFSKFDPQRGSLTTWAAMRAGNVIADIRRKACRNAGKQIQLQPLADDPDGDPFDRIAAPEPEVHGDRDRIAAIERCAFDLSPIEQDVLIRRFLEPQQASLQAIADAHGISRKRLAAVERRVRRLLQDAIEAAA